MTAAFCTYFDHRYLSRGLTMFDSLQRHCPQARLWVLCLSDECHATLERLHLPGLTAIRLSDFERQDPQLLAAKQNRSAIEYYFTCTPSLPLYVFRSEPDLGSITYVDADLYFLGSPAPVFAEIGAASIAITPHRFAPHQKWMEQNGTFNVGWLTFRRDDNGMACLQWWRERCLEWCHDYIDGDRFADQKYLDRFPQLFQGVRIIEHKGANLAAWNIGNYRITERGGTLWVDELPIIFYHYHGLKQIAPGVVDPALAHYGVQLSPLMKSRLFLPYIAKLNESRKQTGAAAAAGLTRKASTASAGFPKRAARFLGAYAGLLSGKYLAATME